LKVAILGSQGFVGKNLVEVFDEKFDLISADIYKSGTGKNYEHIDVRQFEQVKEILKDVDVLIDLVANNLISSFDQIVENAKVNIIGLLNILEACRINNVKKIIFPSASSMIGKASINPVPEDHIPHPKTPYGVTKLASEHYIRLYNELYGINFVIFRFFNIYGSHQLNGLIPSLIFRMKKNEKITIFGKGDQIRDYVFVKDLANFFEKSINSSSVNNKIINMGSGKGSTIMQVVKHISNFMKVTPKIEYLPEQSGEIGNFVADTKLLKTVFGTVPKTTLEEGLLSTVKWYKTQPN